MTNPQAPQRSGTLQPGAHLGPYEIVEPLGAGGMGEVYRAKDSRLGRDVAVKVLPESVSMDPESLTRFEREARAVGALNHPNILTIHDVGSHEGTPYVVTELLEGETLREVLVRRAPTPRQVLGWSIQVSDGLAAAHRKRIVHRDLKPENLFLTTDGRIKILDFGLAKLESRPDVESGAATASGATQSGVLLGTVAYMAPEQIRAEGADQRSDLFSLGVVLFELLAQEHPFRRETVPATLTAILHESPGKVSTRQAGISPGLDRIVERCLEKRKDDRFQTAHDLSLALEAVLQRPTGAVSLLDVEERSPYPGLSSFTEEDAGRFFGREDEVKALWQKLRERLLLAVIGPSGAGKTSFIRAGVVAGKSDGWAAIVSTPGTAPLRGLGQALGPELSGDSEALRKLAGFEDPETAFELLARWRNGHEEALIVLDQFEELFTLNPPETQARFVALLARVVDEAEVHLILSMRDDFLMRCHDHPALAPVFLNLTPLGPLTRDGLRRAVIEPAAKQGYRFEDDDLVEEILGAVEGARAALPLLAFAVSRHWERRDREKKVLTREAYREIGGVEGALAQHAEATLERIGVEREGIVRDIFRNLTTAQGTRAVLEREELLSAFPDRAVAEAVLKQLIDSRLLTSYETEGSDGKPASHQVEILHESLLKAWPRLVRWQTQAADGAQLRDQLRQAARLWHERGDAEDLLWTGASYLDYRAWRERFPEKLSSIEEEFAGSMTGLANKKRRQRRIAVAVVGTALVVGLGVMGMLWTRSENARKKADAQTLRAEASKLLALGQLEMETYPTGALAYAIKSLELADTQEARRFALRVLQMGPVATTAQVHRKDGFDAVSLSFSANGNWLAVGGSRGAQLLRRSGGEPVVLRGEYPHAGAYFPALGLDASGGRLVMNRSGDIRVWSVPEGDEIRRVKLEEGPSKLWMRGSGFFTSTTVGRKNVIRWSPAGEGESRLIGSMEPIDQWRIDIDPAGKRLAYPLGRRVYVRSLESWASPPRLAAEDSADVKDVKFHPGGELLAAKAKSGEIRIWPVAGGSNRPLRVIDAKVEEDYVFGFSPGGKWLAVEKVTDGRPLVELWSLSAPPNAEPLALRTDSLLNMRLNMAFDPTEKWLAIAIDVNHVAYYPLEESFLHTLGRTRSVGINFTPDGSSLLWLSGEGSLRAWPLDSRADSEPRILFKNDKALDGISLSADGTQVAVAGEAGHVWVVPIAGGAARELKGFSERVNDLCIAFSPDGQRVAAASGFSSAPEKVIRIWDLQSGAVQVLGPVPGAAEGADGRIETLFFRGQDQLLAGVLGTGLVRYDVRDGKSTILSSEIIPWVFSRDGQFGLGAGASIASHERGELYRFGPDGGAPTLLKNYPRTSAKTLNATGTVIAAGSDDGIVRIGPVSGAEPYLFFGHKAEVSMIAFSPDGRWVASAGEDTTIRLWPVPDVTKTPPHMRPHEEFLSTLKSWTNLRAVADAKSSTGWKLEPGPFPGWQKVPKW